MLGVPLIALLAGGAFVVATRKAPPDRRPVLLPETLDGLSRASDSVAGPMVERTEASLNEWWPNRSSAYAQYASDDLQFAAGSSRAADLCQAAGQHVLVVRGRFGDKGVARLGEKMREKDLGKAYVPSQLSGKTSCDQVSETLAVCWRETDGLSVSVLTMEQSDAPRVLSQVDEVWSAVR